MIRPIDLDICDGYEYEGDPERTAILLPGSLLGGMPVNAFVALPLMRAGWRVVQVWDDARRALDRERWSVERAEAALAYAGEARLISGKSAGSLAASFAAAHGLAAIWTTPLLDHPLCAEGLRDRTAPALLIGGTADESWDPALARKLADEVCEIDGADHSLARASDLAEVERAVSVFSARLLLRA
ncbi:MAG: alpha/beta hydrolase [Gaiellaceae bacterium]